MALSLAAALEAQSAPDVPQPFVPSQQLNKQLPRWLRFSGEYRMRVEGFSGGGFRENNEDAYFLNRVRLNMKIEAAPWMRFSLQGQDSGDFQAIYSASKQLQIGGGFAHIFAGAFLKKATPGKGYHFPYVMLGYSS